MGVVVEGFLAPEFEAVARLFEQSYDATGADGEAAGDARSVEFEFGAPKAGWD